MKFALLTYYTTWPVDYQPIADIIIPNRDAYCRRHGYDHAVATGLSYDLPDSQYYARYRLQYLCDYLMGHGTVDYCWVLNVSSYITGPEKRLEDLVDDHHDIYFTHGVGVLNAGSFIVRNCATVWDWLICMVAESVDNDNEQLAIQHSEKDPRFSYLFKILPQRSINSYWHELYGNLYGPLDKLTEGQWQPGDLVISLPGVSLADRLKILREDPRIIS
jgi:hypothetical protein